MNKKSIALFLCFLISVSLLASCKKANQNQDQTNTGNDSQNNNITESSDVIFDTKTNVQFIICDETIDTETLYYLHGEVAEITPSYPTVGNDTLTKANHEIVIGESSRDITKKAFSYLSHLEKENEMSLKKMATEKLVTS